MIDLHIHTKYSDGTDSIKCLLKKAQKTNLDLISITDHNTCKSYIKMEKIDFKKIYKGNIIVGCELTTSFDGVLIEILGYGFDYKYVSKILRKLYNKKKDKEAHKILYKRILDNIKKIGLIFDLKNVKRNRFKNLFFELGVFEELSRHEENKAILKEDIWGSYGDFYRNGLTNVNSKMFVNYAEFKPKLASLIDLIHEAGGIVFLAHPFQYRVDDMDEFLEKIFKENKFDGIECFYTTFSDEQTNYLLEFARKKKLLISGGSDYHGKNKKQHELGIGKGTLNVSENVVSNWNVKYYD